jgi:3-dehydroquinate synthase
VAAGMVLASELSAKMSFISKEEVVMLRELLTEAGLPVEPPDINANDFITAMKSDKKVKDRKIQLVLLKKMGEAFLTSEYSEEDLLEVLGAN